MLYTMEWRKEARDVYFCSCCINNFEQMHLSFPSFSVAISMSHFSQFIDLVTSQERTSECILKRQSSSSWTHMNKTRSFLVALSLTSSWSCKVPAVIFRVEKDCNWKRALAVHGCWPFCSRSMLYRPAALLGGPLVNVLFQYARCWLHSFHQQSLLVHPSSYRLYCWQANVKDAEWFSVLFSDPGWKLSWTKILNQPEFRAAV